MKPACRSKALTASSHLQLLYSFQKVLRRPHNLVGKQGYYWPITRMTWRNIQTGHVNVKPRRKMLCTLLTEIHETGTCTQHVESNIRIAPPTKYTLLYLGFGLLAAKVTK